MSRALGLVCVLWMCSISFADDREEFNKVYQRGLEMMGPEPQPQSFDWISLPIVAFPSATPESIEFERILWAELESTFDKLEVEDFSGLGIYPNKWAEWKLKREHEDLSPADRAKLEQKRNEIIRKFELPFVCKNEGDFIDGVLQGKIEPMLLVFAKKKAHSTYFLEFEKCLKEKVRLNSEYLVRRPMQGFSGVLSEWERPKFERAILITHFGVNGLVSPLPSEIRSAIKATRELYNSPLRQEDPERGSGRIGGSTRRESVHSNDFNGNGQRPIRAESPR